MNRAVCLLLTATLKNFETRLKEMNARICAHNVRMAERAQRSQQAIMPTSMGMDIGTGMRTWKRKPRSFETLPTGEIVVRGMPPTRTTFMRGDHGASEIDFLERVIAAQKRALTAADAERWLVQHRRDKRRQL